ncbi:NAD(P)-binding protein [Teratosphaeria nubilosa]|uniref:NAD(P)-binding protein n=1 Tax=Teratosphaeria nubilosa TaxID=161662 RepID=A0A6G1LP12_9PEZI|nr:NAD(P)-binding protein [Teratosphaeria nubilosa]
MLGSSNKFDPNKDIPDLSGKVFVVTGGSAGIGFGITAHLLQHNPEKIYLHGKKEEHIAEAEKGLEKYGDVSRIQSVQIELEDLHATDQVARKLANELTRLDALVLNAGLGVGVYSETKDGLDSHMQVNVFAQHHLMMVLLPILLRTPDSRVVMQSSEFHRLGTSKVQFNDLAEINQDVGAANLYNRTKLGQVCLTLALARRKAAGKLGLSPGHAPHFLAVHPGGVNTDQPEQAKEAYGTMGKIGVAAVKPFMKDPIDEGCRPALFATTSEDVVKEDLDGVYVVPDRKVTDVANHAKDVELQERCWRLTESTLISKLGRDKVEYAS